MNFVTCLMVVVLCTAMVVHDYPIIQENIKQAQAEKRKLRALADNLILTSRGLTSRQGRDDIEWAAEMAPLAEYVNKHLGE